MKLKFHLGSVVQLDVRLYKTTAHGGLKVVGAALFDVGNALQNYSGIQIKEFPLRGGGVLVAELVFGRNDKGNRIDQSSPTKATTCARFRLSTVQLANPEAKISDTRIKISRIMAVDQQQQQQPGMRVKIDRFGDSIMEFDSQWNWPIRISVYDSRTGVELGSGHQQLHDLLRTNENKVTITNGDTIVGHVEVSSSTQHHHHHANTNTIDKLPEPTVSPPDSTPFRNNVCFAIDFTNTSNHNIIKNNGMISDLNYSIHSIQQPAMHKQKMNAYEMALLSISTKLFSSQQAYTLWGMGARLEGKVRPIFQCGRAETVHGSQALHEAYQSFVTTTTTTAARRHLHDASNGNGGGDDKTAYLNCVIQAACRKQSQVVVLLLSDLRGLDLPRFLRHCESKPKLRVILVAVRQEQEQEQEQQCVSYSNIKHGTDICKNVVFLHANSI